MYVCVCTYIHTYIYIYVYTNNCTVIRYGDIQTHGLPATCVSLFQLSFRKVFNKGKYINGWLCHRCAIRE